MTSQTESSTHEVIAAPNTLADSLSMRYPTVWVHAQDSVEVIERVKAHVGIYEDLGFYVFNALSGLQKFNYRTNRFDTVLTETVHPVTGAPILVPITDLGNAFSYLEDDYSATMVVLNAEQFEDKLNDFLAFSAFAWRSAWRDDKSGMMPAQIILSSATHPSPPPAVFSFVPVVTFSAPTKNDFVQLGMYVKEKTNADFDVDKVASVSRGLSMFEAIDMYHSMIARSNTIDIEAIENLVFSRLAERAGLDIVRPEKLLSQVAGAENLKSILDTSMWIKENAEEARSLGFRSSIHRFLFLGLPGTGKSMAAEASAKEMKLNLIRTGLTQMLSKFHGESEQNTIALFNQIDALDPVAVWCDEFGRDATGGQSSHLVDAGSTARMHGIFLTRLQELAPTTYLFAAANDISTLAPEMLRADRFDRIFFFGFPTYLQRLKIVTDLFASVERHDVNLDEVAKASASYTGAELVSAYALASTAALSERGPMNTRHFRVAMTKMKDRLWNRYREHVKREYRLAVDNYDWASNDQLAEAREFYVHGRVPTGDYVHSTPVKTEQPNQIILTPNIK